MEATGGTGGEIRDLHNHASCQRKKTWKYMISYLLKVWELRIIPFK